MPVLFLVTDGELDELWPGWRLPRITPRRRTVKNPFTNAPHVTLDWDPGPLSSGGTGMDDPRGRPAVAPVLAPGNRAAAQRESEVPALLRTLPHAAVERGALVDVSEVLLERAFRPERCFNGPEAYDVFVCAPRDLIAELARLDVGVVSDLKARWRQRLGREAPVADLPALQALARLAVVRGAHLVEHERV